MDANLPERSISTRVDQIAVSLQDIVASVVLGIFTGAAAGLIGVGGGEFRIPVLLYLFPSHVKTAAGVNMIVGFFTVCLSLVRRWGQQSWSADDVLLAVVLGIASLFGAILGARRANKLSAPILKKVVYVYLVIVGLWMVWEAISHTEHILFQPEEMARWILASAIGFGIAALSGALGVAGGEMRIPALLYLFAVPIKEAGTISLAASIPTVAAGAVTYRRMGHVPNRVFLLTLLMAAGSLAGVLMGTALLPAFDKHALKGILGVILLLATVALVLSNAWSLRSRRGAG